jgi:hypothetical protein
MRWTWVRKSATWRNDVGFEGDEDRIDFEPHICDFCIKEIGDKMDRRLLVEHPEWFRRTAFNVKGWIGQHHVKTKFHNSWYEYRRKAFDKAKRMCVVISMHGSYNCYCSRHLQKFVKVLREHMRSHECYLNSLP